MKKLDKKFKEFNKSIIQFYLILKSTQFFNSLLNNKRLYNT